MGFSCFVKGWLSPIDGFDKENDARRRHYYKKFGFDITEDDFVCLDLSKSDKTSDNGKEKTNDNSSNPPNFSIGFFHLNVHL